MIKKILLENFKAFKHAEIEIKPITILVGPNNGGKSSLLQSIRLIQQTLRGSGEDVLNFREPLNLGDFDNIIHQNYTEKEIRFKFDFGNGKYFDIKIIKEQGKLLVKNFSCNNGEFEYILEEPIEKKDEVKEKSKFYEFAKINFRPKTYNDVIKFENLKPLFLRDTFYFKIRPAINDLILETDTIKRLIESTSKDMEKAKIKIVELLQKLYNFERISSDFYQYIKQDFENIKYISPIRAPAIRSYKKEIYDDVGMTGEHVVQILDNNPKVLLEVEEYLRNMDVVKSLQIDKFDNQKSLELKIKTKITDNPVNLADTGCGTAQILPIIVQSLITQKETLTLIEQPEVHLHPKVQADLADFFVKVASNDKRFLLETHSDYFLERIRYCIMDKKISTEDVAIYYVEQDEANKCSNVIEIKINSKGQYSTSNLPDGNLPDNYVSNFKLEENRKMMKKLLENLSK